MAYQGTTKPIARTQDCVSIVHEGSPEGIQPIKDAKSTHLIASGSSTGRRALPEPNPGRHDFPDSAVVRSA
jgi:hypothetical protein